MTHYLLLNLSLYLFCPHQYSNIILHFPKYCITGHFMKIFTLLKIRKIRLIWMIPFFYLSQFTQAQCPTIPVNTQIICDAAGLDFNDLDIYAIATPGNDIKWYLNPTGGTPLPDIQLVREGTYYAGDTSGSCGTRPALTIDFEVDRTLLSLDAIFCSNENPTIQSYIDEALAVSIPTGGSVQIYSDFLLTNQLSTSMMLSGNSNYFIVFTDATGCTSQIQTGSTAVFPSPVAPNPPLVQQFCSDTNPTVNDLDPGTTDNFSWYSSVDGTNNPIPPAFVGTEALIDGATYYVQADNFFCDSDAVAIVVEISDPSNAGMNNNEQYCEDNIPSNDIDLFPLLGPNVDNGGTWSGPIATTNGDQGTLNLTGQGVGVYSFVYTVAGQNACPDATATVTIEILEILSSGIPSSLNPASFCVSQLPSSFDLFSLLDNEDAGGIWTQGTSSAAPTVVSPIDLTGFTAGTYDFTYVQNALPNPCPEDTTTIQIIVLENPNAGVALTTQFCENDLVANSPFNLIDALDGSQDNDLGTWTDASNNVVSNVIDLNNFNVIDSPYTFTYTIDNGSCQDSEIISIDILAAPESGNYVGTPFTVCEDQTTSNSPYDLFNLLDGTQDTNGAWFEGATSTGTAVTNPIDLTTLGTGTFDFTYSVPAIGTCTDNDVTVTVIINPLPNTGTPTPLLVCENDLTANSPVDLFNQLTGQDSGGMWSDDDATGALTGSNVDISGFTVGSFNFSYSITDVNGCMNSSIVTITVEPAPESGNYVGTPFTVCENQTIANSPYDLFNLLDGTQDTNGTWFEGATSTGTAVTNPIDLTTIGTGTFDFTYSVPAIGTCTDNDVTVTVIINSLVNAGTEIPYIICENELSNNSPLDLFNQLAGQDSGGVWSDDDSTGLLSGNVLDLNGLTVGDFNFTYTVNNGTCSDSETVLISVIPAPNAGVATNFEICLSDVISGQTIDLFNQLTGNDIGGIWSDDNSTGELNGSIVNLSNLISGTYNFTYTVLPSSNCSSDTSTVEITVNDVAAPTVAPDQLFCDQATVNDLVATGNAVVWYADASLTLPLDPNDALIDGEDYFATQIDPITNCESSLFSSTLVTINVSPNSGNAISTTICNDQNMVDLFLSLDGTQDSGGIWVDTDNTGAITNNIFDATSVVDGTYNFEYIVAGVAPCIDASTLITITVVSPVDAGNDATLDICTDTNTVDLFTLLGASATTGGTWSPTLTSGTGLFDPAVDLEGVYMYSVSNACNVSTASVDVTITDAPDAGTDNSINLCVIDGSLDLLTQLGGTPDDNGTWSPLLNSGTNLFDPILDGSGTYVYTVAATGACSNDSSATLTIQVDDSPDPTLVNTNLFFCATENATVIDLDAAVNGSMILWYDAIDSTIPLLSTDLLIDGQSYFATQTISNGCESSERTQVQVEIGDAPTPTLAQDGALFCINDNPTLQQLTLNIQEYEANLNNVIWYDSLTGTNSIPLTTVMTIGSTYYVVLIDPVTGCESSVRLAVTVDLSACGNLTIPDGFSPNGDGVNDVFDIDNLDFLYPNFELEFYNRYGNMVYNGTINTPRFNGFSNQSGLLNDGELPVGVYFYILKYNDGITKPSQGRIYLSR